MITAEMEVDEIETAAAVEEVDEDGIPYSDTVYPPELIAEWDRESDEIERAYNAGWRPKPLAEQFAECRNERY